MPTLSNAPLIEVIFRAKWADIQTQDIDSIQLGVSHEEQETFLGRFTSKAEVTGFDTIERVNPSMPIVPHAVAYRCRKAPDVWPCYQAGLGIFTVNQVNDGYKWEEYVKAVHDGVSLLEDSYPFSLSELKNCTLDLRYQDGFLFNETEQPLDFLREKMALNFDLPEKFLSIPEIEGHAFGNQIQFQLNISKPTGVLIVNLLQGEINGTPGFVMNTATVAKDAASILADKQLLDEWLDAAHKIQQHTFKELIQPALARKFQ